MVYPVFPPLHTVDLTRVLKMSQVPRMCSLQAESWVWLRGSQVSGRLTCAGDTSWAEDTAVKDTADGPHVRD